MNTCDVVKVDFDEGQTVEFKERFSSHKWLEDIVSFVNTDGGKIYFGIAKNKEVVGVQINADDKNRITPKRDVHNPSSAKTHSSEP